MTLKKNFVSNSKKCILNNIQTQIDDLLSVTTLLKIRMDTSSVVINRVWFNYCSYTSNHTYNEIN